MSKNPELKISNKPNAPFDSTFQLTILANEKTNESGYSPSKPVSALFLLSLLLETMGNVISQMTKETLRQQDEATKRFMGDSYKNPVIGQDDA